MTPATLGLTTGSSWSAVCAALVVWAALSQPAAAADPESVPCLMTTKFEEIRDKFINRQGRLAAAPVTTFLSGDSSARLVFQQALGENANLKIFRVFETDNADIKSIKGTELPVLSVQPALEKLVDGYRPNDSVLLRVEIDPQTPLLWREHHFLILACSGGQVSSWGLVTARVSSPFISFLVCAVVAFLVYVLAMSAVWVSRRSSHPLEAKYPAFFAAKKISLGTLSIRSTLRRMPSIRRAFRSCRSCYSRSWWAGFCSLSSCGLALLPICRQL